MAKSERTGLFTPRQRQYLSGEHDELDSGDERALRGKIRDRIDTVFAEFELLGELSERDRRQIFDKQLFYDESDLEVQGGTEEAGKPKREKERWEAGGKGGLQRGFLELAKFFYTGYREQGHDPDAFIGDLVDPIWRGEAEFQDVSEDRVTVDLNGDVTVLSGDVDPVKKWQRGHTLTNEEFEKLHRRVRKHVSPDDLINNDLDDLVKKHLTSNE